MVVLIKNNLCTTYTNEVLCLDLVVKIEGSFTMSQVFEAPYYIWPTRLALGAWNGIDGCGLGMLTQNRNMVVTWTGSGKMGTIRLGSRVGWIVLVE